MKPLISISRTAVAIAACMVLVTASHAAAAPLRVVAPTAPGKAAPAVRWVTDLLAERLAECGGVDLVRGERAAKAYAWAHDPVLDLSDSERWRRFESLIAVDALISVERPDEAIRNKEPATDVQVRIFRANGQTVLRAAIGENGADTPKVIAEFARRIGKELTLDEKDIATLAEIRIDDPSVFRQYYATRTASASWPVNPWTASLATINGTQSGKPHWATDAATLRVVAGYIEFAVNGRLSERLPHAATMARAPLIRLLGTGHDDEAMPLLRLPRRDSAKAVIDDIEAVLVQIASPLVREGGATGNASVAAKRGDLSDLDSDPTKDKADMPDAVAAPTDLSARTGTNDYTRAQRLSALRMLGVLTSPEAFALLRRAATQPQADVRAVAAESLGAFKSDESLDMLRALDRDKDDAVAFAAAVSLAQRGAGGSDFVARATAKLSGPEPWRTRAALALAKHATTKDRALLERLASDPSQAVRRAAASKRTEASGHTLADTMKDADDAVILAAIARVRDDALTIGGDEFNRLAALANDPDEAVTRAAREKLRPLRPKDAIARAKFDLAVESPYLRRKAVGVLKASGDADARAELLAACTNADASTRIAALQAVVKSDTNAARAALIKAVTDRHRLVRLHASALLAPIATAAEAATIRSVSERETDRAISLYFADALARIENKPPPAPRSRANRVDGDTTIAVISSPLRPFTATPFRAQYKPSHGNHVRDDEVSETNKRDHDAGMAYFYNISSPPEPGLALVDRAEQDSYWRYIDDQLDTPHLPYIDGIDFMNAALYPDALWPEGWLAFCDDTGIDPARVKGDKRALSVFEQRAWNVWALRRCVEGRNLVYEFVQLKIAKLHPGFQVCMSITGAPMSDVKFDVGLCRAESDDRDPGRSVFNRIRVAKTLWPGRPVFCIGEGLVVKDMAIVKYDTKTPTSPMVGRQYGAYTNALTSWIAGADPGWSCIWVTRTVDWAEPSFAGHVVTPDDTVGDAPGLRAAIDSAFENSAPVIRDKEALTKVSAKTPALAPGEKEAAMDGLIDSTLDADKPDTVAQRIARDKAQMLLGFKIYGKHILDMARLFASLPRHGVKADALVIDEPGATSADAGTPAGVELLGYYDCLYDINDVARQGLSPYRFIAVSDPPALSDATIEAITHWLRETPGVLYVHADLTSDNARQASTPEQFDGRLRSDWPWERDVSVAAAPTPKPDPERPAKKPAVKLASPDGAAVELPGASVLRSFELKGNTVKAAYTFSGAAVLAVWRHPEFKGAVVFDGVAKGGLPYHRALRGVLADLKKRDGVGIDTLAPARHARLVTAAWTAQVASPSSEPQTLDGVDLLTGERSPVVGPGKSGAFVARDFTGKFAAAGHGVGVLCDAPIRRFEKIDGGVRIECDGLIQAASNTGDLAVTPGDGAALPAIKREDRVRWMLLESGEGVASEDAGGDSQPSKVYYIRSKRPVTIKTK